MIPAVLVGVGLIFIGVGFHLSHNQTQKSIKEIRFGNYHELLKENINKKYPPLSKSKVNEISENLTQEELRVLFQYIDTADGKKGYRSPNKGPMRDAENKLHKKGLIYSHWWFSEVDEVTNIPLDRSGVTPWGRQVAKLFTRIEGQEPVE